MTNLTAGRCANRDAVALRFLIRKVTQKLRYAQIRGGCVGPIFIV